MARGKKTADIIIYDKEQTKALEDLHRAMGTFGQAVLACNEAGIPPADALTAIGIEVPVFFRPILNSMGEKIPSPNGKSKDSVKVLQEATNS